MGVGVIGLVEEDEEGFVMVGEGGGDEEKMRARRWATVVLPEEEGPERATRKGGWWGLDISFPERRGSISGSCFVTFRSYTPYFHRCSNSCCKSSQGYSAGSSHGLIVHAYDAPRWDMGVFCQHTTDIAYQVLSLQ